MGAAVLCDAPSVSEKSESEHIGAFALSLYVGATCISATMAFRRARRRWHRRVKRFALALKGRRTGSTLYRLTAILSIMTCKRRRPVRMTSSCVARKYASSARHTQPICRTVNLSLAGFPGQASIMKIVTFLTIRMTTPCRPCTVLRSVTEILICAKRALHSRHSRQSRAMYAPR